MKECCKNCINFHRLEHNFKVGKGYEESYACDMLLQFEDGDLIVEVSEDGMCEMFTAKEQENEYSD